MALDKEGAQNPSQTLGYRGGRPRVIDSVDDAGTERLAVDSKLGGISEINLDETNDEVAVFGGIDGSETANAATRQIINVDAVGRVRSDSTLQIADADVSNTNPVPVSAQGNVAHDAVDSGNPVKVGAKALAHGANPTAVAAADRTDLYANRHGIPWVIGGHPNVKTREFAWTAVKTDVAIVTVAAGLKIVVTRLGATIDEATTVGVGVRIGFAAATLPADPADGATADGMLLTHPGIVPGGGITVGDGSGILGVGADGEDLRITAEVPTTGKGKVNVSWYEVES